MEHKLFSDRRVLITGASSGIGLALARELARQGARLLLVARRQELLQSHVGELTALGAPSVRVLPGDITDSALSEQAIQFAQTHWQGLDLLIHSAGVSAHGPFDSSDEATLRRIMDVNFFAAVNLTRIALPLLRVGMDPQVVLIGSVLGHSGVPYNNEYVASKFALRGWSQSLRAEIQSQGIGVLLVSPGTTDTSFFDHLLVRQLVMPWGKRQGISAATVARQTVHAIRHHRREIFPNWRGRLLVWMTRCCPGLVAWKMGRYEEKRKAGNEKRMEGE
jgi:short-subunit dehydrogenase